MPLISLIHPSRGRAEKSLQTCIRWIARAGVDIQLIISVDKSDPAAKDYIRNAVELQCEIYVNDNYSAVDAINSGAEFATGDILIIVSDDTDCPDNWGNLLLKEVKGKTDWILKCKDGIQDWIITMPVMDRAYYNRFNYIYHPDYAHMFCDTELSCVADLTGRRITSNLLFPHLHYSTGACAADEVSKKADKTWSQGEALFLHRHKNRFFLNETTGRITDQTYINWAASKGVKVNW